jgi:hypothetical protein
VTLFVDTSCWYAAADAGDRSNERCRLVLSAGEPLLTTDHVLVETWVLALVTRMLKRSGDGEAGGELRHHPNGAYWRVTAIWKVSGIRRREPLVDP